MVMLAAALVVLQHVTVIDVKAGAALPDRAVEIEGGTIRAVVPAASYRAPADARVMDLTGRYLVPGFIDMHAHVLFPPLDDDGRPLPAYDRETALHMLRSLLSNGITTVRDPGDATEAIVTMRRLVAEGKVEGPAIVAAGRILTTNNLRHAIYAPVHTEREVRDEVAWQAKVGVDLIKVYADMPPNLVRTAIEEARARGVPVVGHLQATTWTEAARLGISAIAHAAPWTRECLPESARAGYQETMWGRVYWLEHLDLSAPQVIEMADTLASHHVAVDPTLMAFRTKFWGNDPRYTQNPDRELAPPRLWAAFAQRSNTADWTPEQYRAAKQAWPKLLALVKLLYDHGVTITAGTDTPFPWIVPGASFHEELRLLVSAGLPGAAVLRAGTIAAAGSLGRDRMIGSIEVGKQADLVVLGGNPLESIANSAKIEYVIQGGNVVSRGGSRR